MQISDRSGIACDLCGSAYHLDFTYYSFDFRLLAVHNNRRPSLNDIFRTRVSFSLDVCTACFERMKEDIVKHYESTMTNDVRKRGRAAQTLVCELSGKKLTGASFNYYHCNVVKVDVRMSGQPNICVACQTQTMETGKPCGNCGGVDFVRLADTRADDRFVELNICEETFSAMVDKAEAVRKSSGQWSTRVDDV